MEVSTRVTCLFLSLQDFKDDDMDRCFKMFAQLNLKSPMSNCLPSQSRSVIYEGDLRFRDNIKEARKKHYLKNNNLLAFIHFGCIRL